MFTLMILAFGAVAAVYLIYLAAQFSRMGKHRIDVAVEKAKIYLEKGRLDKAERRLLSSMRINGWDYQTYLSGKKANKALNIEQTVPRVTSIARAVKLIPRKNIDWMLPAMMLLGTIYQKQGKAKKGIRLYEDTLNFIEGYGDDLPYVIRSRYLSKVHQEQAVIEHNMKNWSSSLRLQIRAYIEKVASFKAAGDEQSFSDNFPYNGDELLSANLVALKRGRDRAALIEFVNKSIRNWQGRINTQVVMRELEVFLAGGRSRNETEQQVTRDIIHKALTKAAGEDKPEEDKEEEKEKKPNVIILGG